MGANFPRSTPRLGQTGQSLIEMAILLPFLLLVLLGTIDFCRVFYAGVALTQASRAGAQYGVQNATGALSSLTAGMTQAAANVANDYGLTLTAQPVSQRCCQCSGGPPTCPTSGCGTCPPTGCPTSYQIYVCTSAAYTFSTFVPYPGIPHTVNLTRAAVMRVQ